MLNRCYICGGDITARIMTIDFHWGIGVLVFEDMPLQVCQRCGEKYFDSEVYQRLERLSEINYGLPAFLTEDAVLFG